MLSAEDLEGCIRLARSYEEAQSSVDGKDATISPPASTFSLGSTAFSSYTPDPHAVSKVEAQSYYALG